MARPVPSSVSVSRRGSAGGDPERTVVWLRGEHDIATRASLAVSIGRAAQLDDLPLLVDLSAVTFMDASTIGAIVGSWDRLRSRGQTLELRAPSPAARRVLELSGLAHLIQTGPLHSTGAAAALATWVDVAPIAPAEREDHCTALAPADIHVEEAVATVGVLRGGP